MTIHRVAATLALAGSVLGAALARAEGTPIDQSVAAEADSEIKIENLVGRVTVTVGSDDRVHVGGMLGENAKGVVVTTDDEDVRIEVQLPRRVENISGTDLEIQVPRNATLTIETESAEVSIQGAAGKIGVETVSGNITVETTAGDQRVRLESVSGAVTVRGNIGDVRAESVSGKIEIGDAGGEIEASTTSGGIQVSGEALRYVELSSVSGSIAVDGDPAPGAELELENLSGSVGLRLSPDANAEIRVETFTGKIESDFDGGVQNKGKETGEWLTTVVGKGGASVTISTFSGSVSLRKR
ncbi:MAG: DUF4097 family beta strand repeat-containing protein [bacterium]